MRDYFVAYGRLPCTRVITIDIHLDTGCLSSLLGDGDKGNEIVCGEENIFRTRQTRAAREEKKTFVPARQAQERTSFICTL